VFVNVGLGFHVEFTPKEALSFIELKEAHLTGYAAPRELVPLCSVSLNGAQARERAGRDRQQHKVAHPNGTRSHSPPSCWPNPYSNFLHQMYTGIAELMKLATINEEDGR
jgi:hypothetical protein